MTVKTAINSEDYIKGLLNEIERLKDAGRHTLYRINDKMLQPVLNDVSAYFAKEPYTIEIKPCARCTNSYDIVITF